ncbi:hypothetical protein AOLI_G00212430 [Acnodon oligacanthus]
MNAVSIGEYHGLRVGSALLSIVAGCIIIGVSKDCDADAVGGIFLGAGGLGPRRLPVVPPGPRPYLLLRQACCCGVGQTQQEETFQVVSFVKVACWKKDPDLAMPFFCGLLPRASALVG